MRITSLAFLDLAFAAVLTASALVVPTRVPAQGCAMCKTALDGAVDPLTAAFNVSSLFLMAIPYMVVGTVGAWIYIASRRRVRHVEHDDAAHELE